MGFGLLLIGYFTASIMSFNIFGAFFKLAGYTIALAGIRKLSQYNKSFSILALSCISAIAISVCCAFGNLSDFLYDNQIISTKIVSDALINAFSYARYVLELVFNALLCLSVVAISKETGAPKLVYISIRNLVIYCIYFVLQVVCWMPTDAIRAFLEKTALPAWVLILNILILVLNVLMLFSAYTKICDESDVDMPQKPSKFEFVNQMRAEREEKEKARQAKFSKPSTEQKLEGDGYSDEQQRRSAANAKKKKRK